MMSKPMAFTGQVYLAPDLEFLELSSSQSLLQASGEIDDLVINDPVDGDGIFK